MINIWSILFCSVVDDILLMYFPLFVMVLCLSLLLVCITFCPFEVCNHLEKEERAGCFAFIVLRVSCYCKCSVALLPVAVGWSSVCDCGIS